MTRLTPKFAQLIAAGVAALLLTGCLRADIGIQVGDDESGTFRAKMLVNRAKIEQLSTMFGEEDADDPCAELIDDPGDLPDDATLTPVDEGDWCGVDVSMPFDDLAELSELTADFNDESDSDDDPSPFGQVSVTKLTDGYRFEATGVAMSQDDMGFGESDAGDMGQLVEMIEQMMGDMRVSYVVRLPGRPTEHNADSVDGNTFTYDLRLGDTRTELFAETGPGQPDSSGGGDGGSNSTLWIVVAIVGVAVVGAIAFAVLRSRKAAGSTPAGPGAGTPGDTPGRSFDEVAGERDDPFSAPPAPSTGAPPGSSFDDIVERTRPDWEPPKDF